MKLSNDRTELNNNKKMKCYAKKRQNDELKDIFLEKKKEKIGSKVVKCTPG